MIIKYGMKKDVKEEETHTYNRYIGFNISNELRDALQRYAIDEGVKIPVVIRKAIVKYLKDKEYLDRDKRYL